LFVECLRASLGTVRQDTHQPILAFLMGFFPRVREERCWVQRPFPNEAIRILRIGLEKAATNSLTPLRIAHNLFYPLGREGGLDELTEPIQPSPQDITRAPGSFEEAAEVIQGVSRDFVRVPIAAEPLRRITRANPNGFNDILGGVTDLAFMIYTGNPNS
jgi:hypothetical protein